MDSVCMQSNGDVAPGRWRLTAQNIMEFCTAESQTVLGYAFSAWLKCRPKGQAIHLHPFRSDLLDAGARADVRQPDSADSIIEAPESRPMAFRDIKNLLLNRVLMSDLLACRGSRHPLYHQIEHDTGGRNLRYMRLLLPVGGLRRDVVNIYAFCRSFMRRDLTLEQLMATPA